MAYSIASADFDLDGIPDFAFPQLSAGSVRVLSEYKLGSGGFLSELEYSVGIQPVSVAAGDLNVGGLHDIAVGGEDLVLLENRPNSPGSAFSQRSLGIPNVSSIAIADINNDDRNDLAVTSEDSVIVLLQDSPPALPGNFTVSATYTAGTNTADVAIADLNNDSLPDLAVANRGAGIGSISVHMQDPLNIGSFFPAVFYEEGMNANAVAIGDLNNDHLPDMAIANTDITARGISILFQDQQTPGMFLSAVTYPGVSGPYDVAIADMNGDVLTDLVAADKSSIPKGSPYIRFHDINNPGIFSDRVALP
jgi:hypothetical protein